MQSQQIDPRELTRSYGCLGTGPGASEQVLWSVSAAEGPPGQPTYQLIADTSIT